MKAVIGFSAFPEKQEQIESFLEEQYRTKLICSWFSKPINFLSRDGDITVLRYAVVALGANEEFDVFCAKILALLPEQDATWAPIIDEMFSTEMLLDLLPEGRISA